MSINCHVYSTAMQEPAYILKNGQSVPYIPVEVKTARDAYAASLHVLFKHVADFHICIVKTFSAKYGIPEDDILNTIQESDEFKNMQVDPVLDIGTHSLGYLDEVPATEVPATKVPATKVPATKVPKLMATKPKPNAKKTKTLPVADIQVPMAKELVPEEEALIAEAQVPSPKSRPIAYRANQTKHAETVEPVVVESHVTMPDIEIKTKTIRKKVVVPKPVADSRVESAPMPVTKAELDSAPIIIPALASIASIASIASLTSEGDVMRKIIKKKTKTNPLSHPAK